MNGDKRPTESAILSAQKKKKENYAWRWSICHLPGNEYHFLKCCAVVCKENRTGVRKHFMFCQSSRRKFPTAYLELCKSRMDTSAFNGERTEVTSRFRLASSHLCEKLDKSFANSMIEDGLRFNTRQSPSWNPFRTLVSVAAYKMLHYKKPFWHVFAHFIWWHHWKVHQQAKRSQMNLFVNRWLFWYPIKFWFLCNIYVPSTTTCAIILIRMQEGVSSW